MRSVVALLSLVLVGVACGGDGAKLQPLQELPADVAVLVDETWAEFEDAFGGRLDCIPQVTLLLVDDVPDGDAVYREEAGRIEIEMRPSPARLPESLVHELAHHVEASCDEHAALRVPFLAAQGLLGADGWFAGDDWADVPSEHFAEAVVQVVHGERLLHDDVIMLSPEAIEVVRHWARGEA